MYTETVNTLQFVENPTFPTRERRGGRNIKFVAQVLQNPNRWVVCKNFNAEQTEQQQVRTKVYALRGKYKQVEWRLAVTDNGYQIVAKTK